MGKIRPAIDNLSKVHYNVFDYHPDTGIERETYREIAHSQLSARELGEEA